MKVKCEFELRDEVVGAVIAYGDQRGFRLAGKKKKDRKALVKRILESKGNEVLTKALEEYREKEANRKHAERTCDAARKEVDLGPNTATALH